jgi:hypothetical protein
MDNLDSNTLVLSANDSQEPQARYREYTLQQDLLACNKQYGMDPNQIKNQLSMASLPDRRTTPTNPNYGGVESPLHRDLSSWRQIEMAWTMQKIPIATPLRITEELSSHNAPRRSGRVAIKAWNGHAPGRNGGNGGLPRLAGRDGQPAGWPVACCYGEDIGTSKMLRNFTSLASYHYRLPVLFFLLCQIFRKQATLVMYSFVIFFTLLHLTSGSCVGKPMPRGLRALLTHAGVYMGRVSS